MASGDGRIPTMSPPAVGWFRIRLFDELPLLRGRRLLRRGTSACNPGRQPFLLNRHVPNADLAF